MKRWFIVVMSVTVAVCIFFYTPVGLFVSMLTAGVVSLFVGKLQDPVLYFFGMFFLLVLMISGLFLFWLRLKHKKKIF